MYSQCVLSFFSFFGSAICGELATAAPQRSFYFLRLLLGDVVINAMLLRVFVIRIVVCALGIVLVVHGSLVPHFDVYEMDS